MEQQSFFNSREGRFLLSLATLSASVVMLVLAYGLVKDISANPFDKTIIDVTGEGEVVATPDLGTFSFSVAAKADTAAAAQEQSAEAINAILGYLKDNGVEDRDVKTQNYNLNPEYRYEENICLGEGYCPPGERVIDGYRVSQSVHVKVRDLDAAGMLISGVGELGATNISSLGFTIDDTDVLEAEARELAIADAKAEAKQLADDLGMKVVQLVGYRDMDGGYMPEPMFARTGMMDMAFSEEVKISPELPTGEHTVRKSVTISFELR